MTVRTVRYQVTTRYGTRDFTNLADARKCAKAEHNDGWSTMIRDITTDTEVPITRPDPSETKFGLSWKAYGQNQTRSECYGEETWLNACAAAGIDPEGTYDTKAAANAAKESVGRHLHGPELIECRVVREN